MMSIKTQITRIFTNYSLWLFALSWCTILLIISCQQQRAPKDLSGYDVLIDSLEVELEFDFSTVEIDTSVFVNFELENIEKRLKTGGLVNIKNVDSTISIDLRYSTSNNFMGIDMYADFDACYLQKDVAEKLMLAQLLLRTQFPNYSLIVYDGYRPLSVQQKMWEAVKLSPKEKSKYISNPRNYSLHNFGAAVDVSIINEYDEPLDMGTAYDYFGVLAYPRKEEELLRKGLLTGTQVQNRKLLREVMGKAGFEGITTEWWHFNSCTRKEAKSKYKIVE
ncbi:MAG: peptidase M15 [Flavobacteriales bacterium]|nr:MAG: peptidase M15 [Flavobacteriales bacterium]